MNRVRSIPRLVCYAILGVVFASLVSSCATPSPDAVRPREPGVVAGCVIRGDACVLTLENRTWAPVDYFLLTRKGSFSRAPFHSKVFVRRPTGEVRECIWISRFSESVEMEEERMQRLGAKSRETISLPLVEFWNLHQPGWGYSEEKPHGSIEDLRADKDQFKIRIEVYLDGALTKSVSCETEWHDF